MALINRIFPNTISLRSSQSTTSKSDSCLAAGKRLTKQRETIAQAIKNQLNSQKINSNVGDSIGNVQPHFQGAASRTRLLLFRECEVRGRRLLFDSAAGQAKDDTGLQQDIQLMKDMVFGSATLKYFGDNYRVHDFGTVPWRGYHMMLTKVFLVPPPTSSSKVGPSIATKGPLGKVHSSATGTDSGFVDNGASSGSGSGWSSISSPATGASLSSSRASFSSTSLAIPRIGSTRKAVSDSLLGHEPSELDKLSRGRKVRLAIALLFPPDDDVDKDDRTTSVSFRQVIFEQFSLMEHFVQRFQYGVLRAYSSRQNFMNLIHEAIVQFGRDVDNLSAANNKTPAYLILTPASGDPDRTSSRDQVAENFMTRWESIVTETDTKLTHFFWSTLLSAVLTYHVNWFHSYVSHKSEFFDCGTRILVLSKNKSLAERILYLLSYFVRHASVSSDPIHRKSSSADTANRDLPGGHGHLNVNNGKFPRNMNEPANDESTTALVTSTGHLSVPTDSSPSLSHLRSESFRRSSQQLENARYLRNYYDVRFQLSPDTLTKRDGRTTFANVKYSIAKNGFQDFSFRDACNTLSPSTEQQQQQPSNASSQSSAETDAPAFFVGSVPDGSPYQRSEALPQSADSPGDSTPIQVPIPGATALKAKRLRHSPLSRWVYGDTLNSQYQAGRILQSCDPSLCDWLHELQRDLRAAVPQIKTVSCVVANTETWEVQVLTCVEEEKYPLRIKEFWVPVGMSGQVAALVESTQLLWLLQHNPQQCLEHIDERLRFLCHKSEDVGALLSTSIRSWNVDHVNRLLGTETQDLPLLMAGCSVHSPLVAQMGGVTIL